MCFSAPASIIAGTTLCAIGKKTLKKTKSRNEYAFASIPLLFGIQQLAEGAVWMTVGIPYLAAINQIMAYTFLMFAYVIWPTFVPVAILLLEESPNRIKILKIFIGLGVLTSCILLATMITDPVETVIVHNSILYSSTAYFPKFAAVTYITATCVSCMISSHRLVALFGLIMLASCFTAYQCYTDNFVSVWCFFAAILSFIVYLHFVPAKQLVEKVRSKLA